MNHYEYIDEIKEMKSNDNNQEWITCFSDYRYKWIYKIWHKILRIHFIDNQLNKWIDKEKDRDFIFVIQKQDDNEKKSHHFKWINHDCNRIS